MTLPNSGEISTSAIQGEFGGDQALFSYYRGSVVSGALVPDLPENANVPTSGEISLFNEQAPTV